MKIYIFLLFGVLPVSARYVNTSPAGGDSSDGSDTNGNTTLPGDTTPEA